MTCKFCASPSKLLCDGTIIELPSGKRFRWPFHRSSHPGKHSTCDAPMCRQCAVKQMDLTVRTHQGCRRDTRDLCPECVAVKEPVEI